MTPNATAPAIAAEYEAWLRSWASDRTTKARVMIATSRLNDWGLVGFTPTNIQNFLAGPQPGNLELKRPWSKWTKSTYYGHMSDLCRWLVASGHLDADPMENVRSVKRPGHNPNPLSEHDASRVLSVVTGRTRDWILLAMLSGLRAHEIAKLAGEDISMDGIRVLGKGGVDVTLPCHPDLWSMAQRYPRYGFWFPGSDDGHIPSGQVSARVSALFSGMGIKGSIHRCRHLYCTRLLRRGVNVRTVQKLMRHANLETTAAYAAVDEDEMQTAINMLPSLDAQPELV